MASTLAPRPGWLRDLACTRQQALIGAVQISEQQPAHWWDTEGARQPAKPETIVLTPPTLCICGLVHAKGVAYICLSKLCICMHLCACALISMHV